MANRTLDNQRLKSLLESIQNGRCVLFLGPHAAVVPSGVPIEVELEPLVREKLKPTGDPVSFTRLCQRAGKDGIEDVREIAETYLRDLETRQAVSPIHADLAQLPFALIIQTTPDPLMANALAARKRPAQVVAYDYHATQALPDLKSMGSEQEPVIYGLRSLWRNIRSVPLLAEEEVSHLVALIREQPGLPKNLSAALRDSGDNQRSALFVGFEFGAWQTRMLLHGLFATSPTTVIKPMPAVASGPLCPPPPPSDEGIDSLWANYRVVSPSDDDIDFLWTNYRIIFAPSAPADFAAELLTAWKGFTPVTPVAANRQWNRLVLLKLVRDLPEEDLENVAFSFDEFDKEFSRPWKNKEKGERARDLIRWLGENKRLDDLVEWLRQHAAEALAAVEGSLFKA
jgi:hypothetical protein